MTTLAAALMLVVLGASGAGAVDIKGKWGIGAGVLGDFSIGLEYFTKWHFSVAAHAGLARVGWIHSVERQSVPGSEARIVRNTEFASIGLSPVLYVRGYF